MGLTITRTGVDWVQDLKQDSTDGGTRASGAWEWIGWGTGSGGVGTEDDTDSTLTSEGAEARVEAVTSRVTGIFTDDTLRSVGTITSLSTQGIDEVGLFNQLVVAGSILLERGTILEVNLESGDRIEFTLDDRQRAAGSA
jgi:hypothetical protein